MTQPRLNLTNIQTSTMKLLVKPGIIPRLFEPQERKDHRKNLSELQKAAVKEINAEKLREEHQSVSILNQLQHQQRISIAKQVHETEMQELEPSRQESLLNCVVSILESRDKKLEEANNHQGAVSPALLERCTQLIQETHLQAAQRILDANDA